MSFKPFSISLGESLPLDRCPHCGVARPYLKRTAIHKNEKRGQIWCVYECSFCGYLVTAWTMARDPDGAAFAIYPDSPTVSDAILERPRTYLQQSQDGLAQPSGSIMLCASAVDAMLKDKGLKEGRLVSRIDQAAREHLITETMAKWAHEVRLDAND